MKRKLFLGLLAAAAVSFTACQKDQTLSEVTEDNTAIGFGTYVGRDAQTKAYITGIEQLKGLAAGFGVFAYYTGNDPYPDGVHSFTPAFMTNQQVYFKNWGSGEEWGYDTPKYWPGKTDANKTSFFAYAPFITIGSPAPASGITSLPLVDSQGDPVLGFTDPVAVSNQFDLLYATPVKNTYYDKDDNNGYVNFIFNHALSRIGFKASASASNYQVKISEISISGNFNKSGKLNLDSGEWNTLNTETIEYTLNTFDYSGYLGTSPELLTTDGNYLMILPTTTKLDPEDSDLIKINVSVTVTYSYKYEYLSGQWTEPVDGIATGTVNLDFQQGKAYTLSFSINPGLENYPIKFNVTDVTPWAPVTDTNVTVNPLS